MIYTSYFGKVRKLPKDIEIIAICGKSPAYYHGLEYKNQHPNMIFSRFGRKRMIMNIILDVFMNKY